MDDQHVPVFRWPEVSRKLQLGVELDVAVLQAVIHEQVLDELAKPIHLPSTSHGGSATSIGALTVSVASALLIQGLPVVSYGRFREFVRSVEIKAHRGSMGRELILGIPII